MAILEYAIKGRDIDGSFGVVIRGMDPCQVEFDDLVWSCDRDFVEAVVQLLEKRQEKVVSRMGADYAIRFEILEREIDMGDYEDDEEEDWEEPLEFVEEDPEDDTDMDRCLCCGRIVASETMSFPDQHCKKCQEEF